MEEAAGITGRPTLSLAVLPMQGFVGKIIRNNAAFRNKGLIAAPVVGRRYGLLKANSTPTNAAMAVHASLITL
jgi:hypothetical protein